MSLFDFAKYLLVQYSVGEESRMPFFVHDKSLLNLL